MAVNLEMPILIVEDFSTMARFFCSLLDQLGFQNVHHIGDILTAFSKLREKQYGLVLSDWNMEPIFG